MGLPVVTTNVGGIPDFLTHHQTALLVPDDDDRAMAQAVKDLIVNPDLAQSLSKNGRRLAAKFSWEQVRPQWDHVFSDLMMTRPAEALKHSTAITNVSACGSDRQRPTITELF